MSLVPHQIGTCTLRGTGTTFNIYLYTNKSIDSFYIYTILITSGTHLYCTTIKLFFFYRYITSPLKTPITAPPCVPPLATPPTQRRLLPLGFFSCSFGQFLLTNVFLWGIFVLGNRIFCQGTFDLWYHFSF